MLKVYLLKYLVSNFLLLEFTLALNDYGPVIGIISEELSPEMEKSFYDYRSFIAASYVKAVEGSGGRVVPILIGQSEDYYRQMVSVLNGAVFPGGACYFDVLSGYAEAASYIYKYAVEANNNGDYFPIFGVCLGFELLLHLSNNKNELRTNCKSENVGLHLNFYPEFRFSRLYGNMNLELLSILSSMPVTSNHHRMCITPQNMTKTGLDEKWKSLTWNEDDNGIIFISSIESNVYPFFGVQFHPEKNMYEWSKTQNNPHSAQAILTARYFYDWIVAEARKNNHSFQSEVNMLDALINNYKLFYTAKIKLHYDEVYFLQQK